MIIPPLENASSCRSSPYSTRLTLGLGPIFSKGLREEALRGLQSAPHGHCSFPVLRGIGFTETPLRYRYFAVSWRNFGGTLCSGKIFTARRGLARVQSRRNKKAALKMMRGLLKKHGFVPDTFITDKLPSYGAALKNLGLTKHHGFGGRKNNRAENLSCLWENTYLPNRAS